MLNLNRRLPAEWEDQDGIIIAWPHGFSDWRPVLSLVEPVFAEITAHVSKFEQVIVVAPDPDAVRLVLERTSAEQDRIRIIRLETNDTWSRDFGPITVLENETPLLLDFGFNGWGLKFAADKDNLVTSRLHKAGVFGSTPLLKADMVLEGGSIESDGQGTMLTTAQCLLSPNRNPHLDKDGIEARFSEYFGADHFLWLNHGFLAGDDTDSHIDTLARLCPHNTILHIKTDDTGDEHYQAFLNMENELHAFRTRDGSRYRIESIPLPSPVFDDDGERLPATYANFLVINGAVLVPTYRDKADGAALDIIRDVYPGRSVIGVDCLPLILQHGSLHCVTMQVPKGVLT
ncbi:MAG TPA: agmatine deiminase family protein [Geobacteraceae bacterium]|nr:agmatine deiminase family protein [Geobacteraceae bacterium]